MTSGGLADALANKCELKKMDYMKVVEKPAEVAQEQLEEKSKFVLPGVCISKTRVNLQPKPARGKCAARWSG